MKTTVINLFGGPCCGKSTTAAGLFYELKKRGIECELTGEFAKDKVWGDNSEALADQLYLLGNQWRRTSRLLGKVRYVICDSPLLLCNIYGRNENEEFRKFVRNRHTLTENINFYIERRSEYSQIGRNENEAEALQIDKQIIDEVESVDKLIYVNQENAVNEILKVIENAEKQRNMEAEH